jgi:hypothetical protein
MGETTGNEGCMRAHDIEALMATEAQMKTPDGDEF